MKNRKRDGGPVDTKKYLRKYDGLDIEEDSTETEKENTEPIKILDKWVRPKFNHMGLTIYVEVDPPWMMEKATYKFNLILTRDAERQLKELQKRTGATSFAQIIRRSLAVYDALQEHASAGWELILRNKADKSSEKPVLLV